MVITSNLAVEGISVYIIASCTNGFSCAAYLLGSMFVHLSIYTLLIWLCPLLIYKRLTAGSGWVRTCNYIKTNLLGYLLLGASKHAQMLNLPCI